MSGKVSSFEEKMQRLEEIVRIMEQGRITLDESMKLFQEGTELVRTCTELLDNAELQIKKIDVATDGTPVEEDFDEEL